MNTNAASAHESVGLPLDLIQQECTESLITAVYRQDRNVAIPALMNMGKTYGSVKAALNTGKDVTILEPRTEKYADIVEACDDMGLSYKVLPAFSGKLENVDRAYCPTASGEHDDPEAETPLSENVKNLRGRGANPTEIHERFENEYGHPIPCQKHKDCPYLRAMREIQPDEYDVLIGYYSHAHIERFIEDRITVIDEFPSGAFITSIEGDDLRETVFQWLNDKSELPFNRLDQLTGGALTREDTEAGNQWFQTARPHRDTDGPVSNRRLFADTPLVVYTLLNGERLDNGWKHCNLGNGRFGVYDPNNQAFHLLNRPNLDPSEQVVALDGTFDSTMWEVATGIDFEVENVLDKDRRDSFIRDTIGYHIYCISEYSRPTSGGSYTKPERVRLVCNAIEDIHDPDLAFIGSYGDMYKHKTNLAEAGVLPEASHNREDVIGSGMFEDYNLGLIWGSNHFGDSYVKMWSAFAGEPAEHSGNPRDPDYGSFGNRVNRWMRKALTAQELFRIGRKRNKSVIYLYTRHVPEWLPIEGTAEVFQSWSKGVENVVDTLKSLDGNQWTEPQIRNQTDLKQSRVNECLYDLETVCMIEQVETAMQVNIWRDDGIEQFDPDGFVDLSEVHEATPELPTTETETPEPIKEDMIISTD